MISPFGRKSLKLSEFNVTQLESILKSKYLSNYESIDFSSATMTEHVIYFSMSSFNYDEAKKLVDNISLTLKEQGIKNIRICIRFKNSILPEENQSSLTIPYVKGNINLLNLDLYDAIRHRFPKAHWLSIDQNNISIDIDHIDEAPRSAAEAVRVVLNDFIDDFPSSIKVEISILNYISAEYEFGSTDKNRLDSTVVNSVKFMKILTFLSENSDPEIKKVALTFKEKERGMIAHIEVFAISNHNLESLSQKVKATLEQLFPDLSITFS